MTFRQLTERLLGEVKHMPQPNKTIDYLLLDSRRLALADSTLFFAIKGINHNGHRYIQELYEKGVRSFVVEQNSFSLSVEIIPKANVFLVENSITALQHLAAHHRKQFNIMVLAITGSNGKTIVKEWLGRLLSPEYAIVKSPGSYNSQVGVPLSVWQLNERHSLAIFEAGISQPNEMQKLEHILQPDWGIFTHLGTAHDRHFTSQNQKLLEKWTLFKNCKHVIYHQEQPEVQACAISQKLAHQTLIGWLYNAENQQLTINQSNQPEPASYFIKTPFTNKALQENALHCAVAMLCMAGLFAQTVNERLSMLEPVPMRLETKAGLHNSLLIDDSYNNDLSGLQLALDYLHTQAIDRKKVVIISDLLEMGSSDEPLYRQVSGLLNSYRIDQVHAIGPGFFAHRNLFDSTPISFYADTASFLASLDKPSGYLANQKTREQGLTGAAVLIKGARVFAFEKITVRLQQQAHGTRLEVDLQALVHNFNYYKQKLPAGTKVMVMVKAFAYGAGSVEVARLLQFHRADYLAVAYADEGVTLRRQGINLPIMVMNPTAESFGLLTAYQLEPEVYSLSLLQQLMAFARENTGRHTKPIGIHIKIDTGMHRLGFVEKDITELCSLLKEHKKWLTVLSVFSHLAAADNPQHDDFTRQQIALFDKLSNQVNQLSEKPVLRHILNSAGIERFGQQAFFEMVRLGVGLYGVSGSGQAEGLQTVATLKTVISQIKEVAATDTVGYGRSGNVTKPSRIATLAIGYADGFSRQLSQGKGMVHIHGWPAAVIGNVCMDMVMVDVTNIAEAREGDEVVVFGSSLSVSELARRAGTIPYEILTSVSERVKRVFYS